LNKKGEHESARAYKMNKVSQGMIAMLLLSVSVCFTASFLTFLAVGKSFAVSNLKAAKSFTIGAIITTIVTWALWLRASHELLKQSDIENLRACRFGSNEEYDFATLSYSAGLYFIASGLYIYLFLSLSKATTAEGHITNSAALTSNTIFFAVVAFVCVFVAASGNTWSKAYARINEIRSAEVAIEQAIEQAYGKSGNVVVAHSTQFGVYTAFDVFDLTVPFSDIQNRQFICTALSTEAGDDAGKFLVQGGRVTLGFAIAATILAFFASLYAYARLKTIWLNAVAMCCAIVSILVWGIVSNPILQTRCCEGALCALGSSYGLVSVGALFLLVAIFVEAFIGGEEVQVETYMPPYAYGMADKLEEEVK